MAFRFSVLVCVLLLSGYHARAQIRVEGMVTDKNTGRPLQYAFVIVNRTQNGVFCDNQGGFSITVRADDTLLISQTGYLIEKVFLADSAGKNPVRLAIRLEMKPVQLRTFTVKAPKTFEQILQELEQEERKKAGVQTSIADAVSSPITYLYQQFSRQEQSRRKIAELRSENARQSLFRELFTKYMLAHIIALEENEMDDFMAFSRIGDVYRKFDTEYDLVVFIREQYRLFMKEQE
jgi:hypothetical protein